MIASTSPVTSRRFSKAEASLNAYSENNIPYWPSQANFVLAYFGDYRVAFVEQMRQRGILVRDRNSDPGCAGCVRITLGNRLQTQRLLRELPEALASIGFQPQARPTLAKEAQ